MQQNILKTNKQTEPDLRQTSSALVKSLLLYATILFKSSLFQEWKREQKREEDESWIPFMNAIKNMEFLPIFLLPCLLVKKTSSSSMQ